MPEKFRKIQTVHRDFLLAGDSDDPWFQQLEGYVPQDDPFSKLIVSELSSDAVCFDVGANIGLTMLMMADLCPQGHVYAFEPGPENAKWLHRNVEINGIKNCTIIEAAVGSTIGTLRFGENRAWGFPTDDPEIPGVTVPVLTLDEFVRRTPQIKQVDLIKVDVEGFEPHVLYGSRNLQRDFHPLVWLEFNSWTLLTTLGTNPYSFAQAVMSSMTLERVDDAGTRVPERSPYLFMHEHLLKRGSAEDVLLRLKDDHNIPQLSEMVITPQELSRLRIEVSALRTSTSWRLTAPLRLLKNALTKR